MPKHFHLAHADLDFHVDVRLRPYEDGTWVATADLAGKQDTGMDKDPRRAIEKALEPLGWRYAREMAQSAELEEGHSLRPAKRARQS